MAIRQRSRKTALKVVMLVKNRDVRILGKPDVAAVRRAANGKAWEEVHVVDERHITVCPPKGEKHVRAQSKREIALAETYVRSMVEAFNLNLRPGESPRDIVKIKSITRCLPVDHLWEKQSLVTESVNGEVFDRYKCTRCGVTGKRHGLGATIRLDKKFKRETAFQYCGSSMRKLGMVGLP